MWTYNYTDYDNDFLAHYGIRGQRRGVRRFQNEDGSLTPAGKIRYGYIGRDTNAGRAGGGSSIPKTAKERGYILEPDLKARQVEEKNRQQHEAKTKKEYIQSIVAKQNKLEQSGKFTQNAVMGQAYTGSRILGSGNSKIYINVGIKDGNSPLASVDADDMINRLDHFEDHRDSYRQLLRSQLSRDGYDAEVIESILKDPRYNVENLTYDPETEMYEYSIGSVTSGVTPKKVKFSSKNPTDNSKKPRNPELKPNSKRFQGLK